VDATEAFSVVWTPCGLHDSTLLNGTSCALTRAVVGRCDCCLLEETTNNISIKEDAHLTVGGQVKDGFETGLGDAIDAASSDSAWNSGQRRIVAMKDYFRRRRTQ
jgi:hypothetical protein